MLSAYFQNVSMGRMRHLQSSYLARLLGSDVPYKGQDIKESHAHMGITHDHFEQVRLIVTRCHQQSRKATSRGFGCLRRQALTWILAALRDCVPDAPKYAV